MRTLIVQEGKVFAVYVVRDEDLIAEVGSIDQAKRIKSLVDQQGQAEPLKQKRRGRPPGSGVKKQSTTKKTTRKKGERGGGNGRPRREVKSPLGQPIPEVDDGGPAVTPDQIRNIIGS